MHSIRLTSGALLMTVCLMAACVFAQASEHLPSESASLARAHAKAHPRSHGKAHVKPGQHANKAATQPVAQRASQPDTQPATIIANEPTAIPPKPAQPRRRSVQQLIGSTLLEPRPSATGPARPPLPPSATEPYGPSLTQPLGEPYRPPLTSSANQPYRPTLTAPSPLPPPVSPQLNHCDGGGCTDTGGVRYNGGVGNAVIGPQGQLCNRSGATLQCF
jgi:hypothetical protein